MPLEIKICGLRDEASLDAALDGGADMVGFVFFPPSPRDIQSSALRSSGGGKELYSGEAMKIPSCAENKLWSDIALSGMPSASILAS